MNTTDKILIVILHNLTFLIDPQTLQPLLAVRLMVVTLKSFTLANLSKFSLIFSEAFCIPLKIGLNSIAMFIPSFLLSKINKHVIIKDCKATILLSIHFLF